MTLLPNAADRGPDLVVNTRHVSIMCKIGVKLLPELWEEIPCRFGNGVLRVVFERQLKCHRKAVKTPGEPCWAPASSRHRCRHVWENIITHFKYE